MPGETNTGERELTSATSPPWVVETLSAGDPAIGGKARSLARLSALGLPAPPAIAVTSALWNAMRGVDPRPLPARLASVEDLDALQAASRALLLAPFPTGFVDALDAAVERLRGRPSSVPELEPRGAVVEPDEYSVRSSSPTEDRADALAAGVFDSVLEVRREGLGAAIRRVLASALSPGAWAYALRHHSGDRAPTPCLGVLIHRFVRGNTWGAVAWEPERAKARIDLVAGTLEPSARRTIESAARIAGSHAGGAVELEWVAAGARVVFLQMRAYQGGPVRARDEGDERDESNDRSAGGRALRDPARQPSRPPPSRRDWQWDAAHNPAPLSAAHTGLVEWVDRTCAIGIRQRVRNGYLFWKPASDRTEAAATRSPSPSRSEALARPRQEFDDLVATTERRLRALGEGASLESALLVFGDAYQTLYGHISPACARARATLLQVLQETFEEGDCEGDRAREPSQWLENVESAATERLACARRIAAAGDSAQRRAAIAAYLDRFGDESARWDVAEPTWRECPDRLLMLGAFGGAEESPSRAEAPPLDLALAASSLPAASLPAASFPAGRPPTPVGRARAGGLAGLPASLRSRLEAVPPGARERLTEAVASARDAAAVMEDDDAFYATLQSAVRRALLAVGSRLHAAGRLASPDDVFDLPLTVVRALAAPERPEDLSPDRAARLNRPQGEGVGEGLDLKAMAAAARAAEEAARLAPPLLYLPQAPLSGAARRARPRGAPGGGSRPTLHGQAGSSGHAVGPAVHHPTSTPLPKGAILIASTLLPTELPLIFPAAIVTETGSALGHVAAQARERGIPAVVGVSRALLSIPPGALILVDGDRGEVIRLD